MTRRLNLPDTASVATPDTDGRLFAPSAARNAGAIGDLVASYAPATGRALELASGTGQHVATLARRLPALMWQPSDADPVRIESICAYAEQAALPNLHPPTLIDATTPGWSDVHSGYDLILLVNLLHLISTAEAQTLITETAKALAPGGTFILYGPFMRAGELTSEGDANFHASLIAQDAEIGYKDDFDTLDMLQNVWLDPVDVIEMPANNLALVSRKAG